MDEWGELSLLRAAGQALAGAKEIRKANVNRVKHGRVDDIQGTDLLVAPAVDMERHYENVLMDAYRDVVPEKVRDWLSGIYGFGDGVLPARLLGYIGNPRVAEPYEWEGKILVEREPYDRTVGELWAFCGCGDPALSRCYGYRADSRDKELALGKHTTARAILRAWSDILAKGAEPGEKGHAQSQRAADSEYWTVFQAALEQASEKRHQWQCQNRRPPGGQGPPGCGTKAQPELGAPGSPWRPGHMRAHAHRITHKEFLRDLWLVSG